MTGVITRHPEEPYANSASTVPWEALWVTRAPTRCERQRRSRLSQVDMAYDILVKARAPLHVNDLIERIRAGYGVSVDRESLVSSLTKKVARGDRFLRPAPNTFGLRPEGR